MMHRVLLRKLLREIWQLRAQVASIALVVACGVMTVLAEGGTTLALTSALERYYRDYRFADVFASAKRAPESLASRLRALPGVAAVQTRVMADVTLDVPGLPEPAVGRLVSIPPRPMPTLNDIHLVSGRYPDAARPDEVLLSESFAKANRLSAGDTLSAVINGHWRRLAVTGVAISPDYIGELAPGAVFPDDRRFGVLRMSRPALAALLGMEGAFNDLSLQLAPGAREGPVIEAVDRLLDPYGGLGAYGRSRQHSHESVQGELEQNRVTATIIPAIFLAVSAFILSVVLQRLVRTHRDMIAVLKAFGYTDAQVGLHYLGFALAAVIPGALLGVGAGAWFGVKLTGLYGDFFRFPDLHYRLSLPLTALAVGASVLAAVVGALGAVRRAVRLPPAEAMQPESPARFRRGLVERARLARRLPASARMILRNLERRPLRTLTSSLGVALSISILVVGSFFYDAVAWMERLQFDVIQREDLAIHFAAPRPARVRHDLAHLDGVRRVETFQAAPARIRFGVRSRTVSVTGLDPGASLRRVVDRDGRVRPAPVSGLMLGAPLARLLGAAPGDTVELEFLQGRRTRVRVAVASTVEDLFGLSAYLDADRLRRLAGEGTAVSGAYLRVDRDRLADVEDRLKRLPAVAGAYSPSALRATFEQQLSENLWISVGFLVGLASVLAVAVIYNVARIALAERSRELASLRVLGFTRGEVAVLLLGEQAAITLLAVPLGWGLGIGFVRLVLGAFRSEQYRIPLVVEPRTYLIAAAYVLVAAALAGAAVRRRLDRVDLVAALKTRE